LAVCASCGGGMTLRAGTSRSGGVYRYYSCNTFLKEGPDGVPGASVRMDRLDQSCSTWQTGSSSLSG
jgi:hypothetical protein